MRKRFGVSTNIQLSLRFVWIISAGIIAKMMIVPGIMVREYQTGQSRRTNGKAHALRGSSTDRGAGHGGADADESVMQLAVFVLIPLLTSNRITSSHPIVEIYFLFQLFSFSTNSGVNLLSSLWCSISDC